MTPLESRSLVRGGLFLLALSLLRVGMDRAGPRIPPLEGGAGVLDSLLEESSAIRDETARRTTPLAPGEVLDPNRIGEEEFDRLPGIGPSLARTLVEDRRIRGGFGCPEDLLRVSGIGRATLEKIRPYLDFSRGIPVDLRVEARSSPAAGSRRREVPSSLGNRVSTSPGEEAPVSGTVDVNRASQEELESLPGIGPALAARIMESRARDGPFRRPEDLLRVSGIGPAKLQRIRGLIRSGG